MTEGRDQGSIVFPNAELKFYLDATPQDARGGGLRSCERRGEIVDFVEILSQIVDRDDRDRNRAVGPLAVPKDGKLIDTTDMSQEQVIDHIVHEAKAGSLA